MLELERKTYEEKLSELFKTDAGRFVLIKENKVVGIYSTEREAIHAGYQNFGPAAFFVGKILSEPEKVFYSDFENADVQASKSATYADLIGERCLSNGVWVFNGAKSSFPSGVFLEKVIAEKWIEENRLTGTLTCYPINTGIYDWAIEKGFFKPKKESELSAAFIQKFSSASQEHHHYEDGVCE